jgi:DNA (cytosine-5)-methyltransferase 1
LTLLPTPTRRDYKDGGFVAGVPENALLGRVAWRLLPTPTSALGSGGQTSRSGDRKDERLLSGIARDVSARLLPTPVVSDARGGRNATSGRQEGSSHHGGTTLGDVAYLSAFHEYAPAIERWAGILGRPAPEPTVPTARGEGRRLSPVFVEWMMGLPEGWVTGVEGLTHNAQLKALGNGVVPQQAAAALVSLLAEV